MMHAPSNDPGLGALDVALCGWTPERGAGVIAEPVTCGACQRLGAPAGVRLMEQVVGPRFGARLLSQQDVRAIGAATERGERVRRVWSVRREMRAYFLALVEGASLRSTSDPGRANRVQTSRATPKGGREHAAVERHATTARAITRAGWDEAHLAALIPVLPPAHTRWVSLLMTCGKPVLTCVRPGAERHKDYVRWVSKTAQQVAEECVGGDCTERMVLDVDRYYHDAVRDALLDSGELRARAQGPRPSSRGLGRIDWGLV